MTTETKPELLPRNGDVIAVWFSCGAASAVAAKRTIEKYPQCVVRVINNPVAEEHPDNRRFLTDVEKWLGLQIEIAVNPKWPDASAKTVWEKRKYMSGITGAPCTQELKKEARKYWEMKNHHDYLVLGFTADPKDAARSRNFARAERSNFIPILVEEGITKNDCFRIIQDAGLELPEIYKLGYPNANCIGCVKVSNVTYWNHVRKMHPDVFKERAEFSRQIGCRLARPLKNGGKRIFLDELDPNAKGRPMENISFDCGIFCEEKV